MKRSRKRSGSGASIYELLGSTVTWGGVIIVAFFGLLGGWMAFAPLSSAAIASRVVSPDGSRKAIQHLYKYPKNGLIKSRLSRDLVSGFVKEAQIKKEENEDDGPKNSEKKTLIT